MTHPGRGAIRRRAGVVIVAALVGLLFAFVTTAGGVGMWGEPQLDPPARDSAPTEPDDQEESELADEEPDRFERSNAELPGWLEATMRVLLVAATIIALVALGLAGWRRRPRVRWRRRTAGPQDFEVLPDIASAVVDDADAQRAALATGAPRNAIVRCWLRLEHDVEAAGLSRRASDTSAEFTERVLARYSVDARAATELAALYREARFSEHELDEDARRAALDALDRLHRALAAERIDVASLEETR